MSLKLKIRLSILTMLVLLLGLGGYTFFSLQRLEGGARGIQRANFRSVEYGEQMLRALEALQDQPTAQPPLQQLRRALTREAANITEPGELELWTPSPSSWPTTSAWWMTAPRPPPS